MTIFMTTHYMNEAEYCDRIAIIDYGKIVALDTPNNLKKQVGGDVIKITSKENQKHKDELQTRYKKEIYQEDGILKLEVENGEEFLPRLFNELKTPIDSIELHKPTLEDVFLKITGRQIRQEEASPKDLMRNHFRLRGH
jgi:ABC-2 type transport system ATP-binding protein